MKKKKDYVEETLKDIEKNKVPVMSKDLKAGLDDVNERLRLAKEMV